MSVIEELQVIIEANIKPFKDAMQQAQNEVKRATGAMNSQVNKVKSIFSSLARTVATIGIGKIFLDSIKTAMKVEGSIQQINRTMGESTNAFLKWSKESALAFNMSQSDAMTFGAVFSNLVSGFSSGTAQTMQYTTDLLKASSVIASGTGRTMTDVMERIRSGLLGNTEAIEDLGVNVNVAMLQSTEAFKRFANGKSWDQLDFRTQQQIRLFGILEQTSNKFGGAVFKNTNSSLQQLVAILKDVALNLGNAFLPILNVVLPILSNFAMGLRTVTSYIATFMQALFGKNSAISPVVSTMSSATSAALSGTDAQNGYNSALADTGDTAKKTAKEMNRLLGGFDEINSLSDSGSSGGGLPGGIGGGFSGIDPGPIVEPDTSGIESFANKVKEIFKPAIEAFDRFKEAIKPLTDNVGKILLWLWDNILVPFTTWTISDLIPAFFNLLSGAVKVLNPILEVFMGLGAWLGDSFLKPIASWTGGVIVDVLNGLADVLSSIGDWMSEHKKVIETILIIVGSMATPFLVLTAALKVASIAAGVWSVVCGFASAVTTVLGGAIAFLTTPIGLVCLAIGVVIAIVVLLVKNWNTVKEVAINVWDSIVSAVKAGVDKIKEFFNVIVSFVKDNWQGILLFILNPFAGAFKLIYDNCEWFRSFIANLVNTIAGFFSRLWSNIQNTFSNVGSWFGWVFSNAWAIIKGVFSGVGSFFGWVWSVIIQQFTNIGSVIGGAIGGAFKYVVNSIINFAENTINGFIWAINRAIRLINNIPGVEVSTLNYLDIPRLAKGGIVDSAQMFIAGEAGKEAVMPLENNTGWITDLAEKVSTRMPQGQGSGMSGDIIFQIDGSVIGKVALNQLRKMQRQGGITLMPV